MILNRPMSLTDEIKFCHCLARALLFRRGYYWPGDVFLQSRQVFDYLAKIYGLPDETIYHAPDSNPSYVARTIFESGVPKIFAEKYGHSRTKRYEGETDNSIVCQIYWNYWQMLELISKIPPHLNLWFINLVISNGQLRHIPSAGRNFNGDSTSNIDNKQPAISSSIHKLQQPKSKPLVFTKIRT
jgi:hypothetical protein